jgi:hypothetical protein
MVKHLAIVVGLVALPTVARAEMQPVFDDPPFAQPPPEPEPEPEPIVVAPEPEPMPRCALPLTLEQKQPEAHNKLGFRIAYGTLHLPERDVTTFGLTLHVEHPVFRTVRLFAEYEYLWFDEKEVMSPATAGYAGTGQRAQGGVRAELIGATVRDKVHFYLDAEIGGGLGVISDDIDGVQLMPQAFAGLRAGYDYLWGYNNAHSSRVWEAEFIARAIRFDGGTGAMFGMGMAWGD